MSLKQHKLIIGILFIILPLSSVPGMFDYNFMSAPIWVKLLSISFVCLSIIAGFALIKGIKWGIIAALPVSISIAPAFPFGTALSAYCFWVLLKLETVVNKPDSTIAGNIENLSLLDFVMILSLCTLIPYGAFAGNTLGSLNYIAAAIAVLFSGIGIVSKAFRKSNIAWIYVLTLALSISLFFARSFGMGYGMP